MRACAAAVQTLPSHVSLLTGLLPITNNIVSNGQRLTPSVLTLAQILKGPGLCTGAIVATAPLTKVLVLRERVGAATTPPPLLIAGRLG